VKEIREKYMLYDLSYEDFNMLSKSETYDRRDSVDDYDTYCDLLDAFETMISDEDKSFTRMDIHNIFRVISLCLHLSIMTIMKTGRKLTMTLANNVHKAQIGIYSLIKACYASLFTFLVQRIDSSFSLSLSNNNLQQRRNRNKTSRAYIGILDIFSFESFQINLFEQLCINYYNVAKILTLWII